MTTETRDLGWDDQFLATLAEVARTPEQYAIAQDFALDFYERFVKLCHELLYDRIQGMMWVNMRKPGTVKDEDYAAAAMAIELWLPARVGTMMLTQLRGLS